MKLPRYEWKYEPARIGYRGRLVVRVERRGGAGPINKWVLGDVRWALTKRRLQERMEAEKREANLRLMELEVLFHGGGRPGEPTLMKMLRSALP
jgi:hypothetical protein